MSKNNITLREGQQRALLRLIDFVRSSQKRVFILKGYAGTGKTTLIKSLIGELKNSTLLTTWLRLPAVPPR